MSTRFDDLAERARALPPQEKGALARLLIDALDSNVDPDAEQLWAEEAQRRYVAYQRDEAGAKSGDEVMSRARNRLK